MVLINNKLKLEKCAFLYTEIEYKIPYEGIQPTDRGTVM